MMSALLRNTILLVASKRFPVHKVGRPRVEHSQLLDVFSRVLWTGMPWRAVTDMDFRTAHRHFITWARAGVFETAYRRLQRLARRRTRHGAYLALDTTFIKSVYGMDTIGPNPTDRGRMATKMVALVDQSGLPERIAFHPANVSDHKVIDGVLPAPDHARGLRMYADRGFDSKRARHLVQSHGLTPRIARRQVVEGIWFETRRRVVERFFSWLDKKRRIIVRYDATIVAYGAWTWLASCQLASRRVTFVARS